VAQYATTRSLEPPDYSNQAIHTPTATAKTIAIANLIVNDLTSRSISSSSDVRLIFHIA